MRQPAVIVSDLLRRRRTRRRRIANKKRMMATALHLWLAIVAAAAVLPPVQCRNGGSFLSAPLHVSANVSHPFLACPLAYWFRFAFILGGGGGGGEKKKKKEKSTCVRVYSRFFGLQEVLLKRMREMGAISESCAPVTGRAFLPLSNNTRNQLAF